MHTQPSDKPITDEMLREHRLARKMEDAAPALYEALKAITEASEMQIPFHDSRMQSRIFFAREALSSATE